MIPYWIQEVLSRNQLQLSACLDLEKIKPILSLNDLVSFLVLQNDEFVQKVTGINNYSGDLISVWFESGNTSLNAFRQNTLIPLSTDTSFRDEVDNRLFSIDSKEDRYKDPFIIYDLTPDVFGIVVYPGHFTKSNDLQLQKTVVESVLEVLYVYQTFSEVAKSIFFSQYLELLSFKKS